MRKREAAHQLSSEEVEVGPWDLNGILEIPSDARGLVLFVHGSGSSRLSPRNRYVAGVLNRAGIGTLLFDLLRDEEAEDRNNVFDIPLLAERLEGAAEWVNRQPRADGLALGYFGASTGAAAALVAAARQPDRVDAVVSRGGRPDLAGDWLERVEAPTLLLVGGYDEAVIRMNQDALKRLRSVKDLVVIPGATHLFAEPGTLEEVARLAAEWFHRYLGARPSA
jgi:pimeloyl-ACP methyl ester carboxylesterase